MLVSNFQCFIEMLPSIRFFSSPAPHFLHAKKKSFHLRNTEWKKNHLYVLYFTWIFLQPFQLFDGLAWNFVHICLYLWCQDESLTYNGSLLLFIVFIVKYIKIEFDIIYNYSPRRWSDCLIFPLAPPVGSQKSGNAFFLFL